MLMEEIAVAAQTWPDLDKVARTPGRPVRVVHETRTFDLPSSIWAAMFACYAVFLGALALLVSGSFEALGVVLISACFAVMYFGTASLMTRVARVHRTMAGEAHDVGPGPVETLTGILSYTAAATQILIVPSMLGLFAVSVLLIRIVLG